MPFFARVIQNGDTGTQSEEFYCGSRYILELAFRPSENIVLKKPIPEKLKFTVTVRIDVVAGAVPVVTSVEVVCVVVPPP